MEEAPKRTLFISNIPTNAQESDIKSIFEKYGSITSAFIVKHKGTARSKGIAFVEFEKSHEAEEALSKSDGAVLWMNSLRVTWAKPLSQEERDRKNRNLVRKNSDGQFGSSNPIYSPISNRDEEYRREVQTYDNDNREKYIYQKVYERIIERINIEDSQNYSLYCDQSLYTVVSQRKALLNRLFSEEISQK